MWCERVFEALQGSESFPYGIAGKFGHAFDVQLFHQIAAMGFDGFDAETKLMGNLFSGESFGDQLKNFPLAM